MMKRYERIAKRPAAAQRSLRTIAAVTWRPGDTKSTFESPLRPLGSAICFTMCSEPSYGKRDAIPLTGIKAQIDPRNGCVYWGAEGGRPLAFDFSYAPRDDGYGKILSPTRNPSAVALAYALDSEREKALTRSLLLPAVPQMPDVLLGFRDVPKCQDTRELRAWAEKAGKQLADAWVSDVVTQPDTAGNSTGLFLVHHMFAPDLVIHSLRVFEYFKPLLGRYCRNPAKKTNPQPLPNPATMVGSRLKIDIRQPGWADNQEHCTAALAAMHEALPELCEDDLADALARPEHGVFNSTAAVAALRAFLEKEDPELSAGSTDEDLLSAVRRPDVRLCASRLPIIQCFRLQPGPLDETMMFGPSTLGPAKHADFISSAARWRKPWKDKVQEAIADETPAVG